LIVKVLLWIRFLVLEIELIVGQVVLRALAHAFWVDDLNLVLTLLQALSIYHLHLRLKIDICNFRFDVVTGI
jgi:hypothetical protein